MSEQEIPVESEESEESEESTPKTSTDNVDNPEIQLEFGHLLQTPSSNRPSKHPWIRDKGGKVMQRRSKRPLFSTFLKNSTRPS